tara:strand:+ start:69 stop:635 length:567 start_codon:yes stop_codon:yes gene_type:complete
MYKIIDNFLNPKYFEMIQDEVLGGQYIWGYQDSVSKYETDFPSEESLPDYGFSHTIRWEEGYSQLNPFMASFFADLLLETDTESVLRCRLDMTTYSPKGHIHPPHVDYCRPHTASILYLTNTDAETVLYNEKARTQFELRAIKPSTLTEMTRVKPRENRLLVFDGTHIHTGHSPHDCKRRVLINTDLV